MACCRLGHISESDGWIISASIDGKTKLNSVNDTSIEKSFDFHKTIASASVKGNLLALMFADNEIALYSLLTKKVLFQDKAGDASAIQQDGHWFGPHL